QVWYASRTNWGSVRRGVNFDNLQELSAACRQHAARHLDVMASRRDDRMKRRDFIALFGGAAAWPLAARAQQQGKIYRVGLLSTGGPFGPGDERRKSILAGLAAQGFLEGRNLLFEVRWAEGRYERLSEQAAAFKASNV